MGCSPATYVYALALLDKVQEQHVDFYITKRNAHRLLITAMAISAKYLDDFYYKNSYYANIGGIGLKLLNEMEL